MDVTRPKDWMGKLFLLAFPKVSFSCGGKPSPSSLCFLCVSLLYCSYQTLFLTFLVTKGVEVFFFHTRQFCAAPSGCPTVNSVLTPSSQISQIKGLVPQDLPSSHILQVPFTSQTPMLLTNGLQIGGSSDPFLGFR